MPTTIQCQSDDAFSGILANLDGSLAVSTYQAGKLMLIGWHDERPRVFMREMDKPMGIAIRGASMAVGLAKSVLMLANAPSLAHNFAEPGDSLDALFLPRATLHTGDIAVHEIAFDGRGELWMCNTHFSCLCSPSSLTSFEPKWMPPFISKLAPQDRCHLNGLAMLDGKPSVVSCFGVCDSDHGWRSNKTNGGCLVSVSENEVIATGLSMPHSPRWHDGKLWVLNSGLGQFLTIEPNSGDQTVVATLPGYVRGLLMAKDFAFVGMSMLRHQDDFQGLAVQDRTEPLVCGIAAVELRSGRVAGMFSFESGCTELFDIQLLSKARSGLLLTPDQAECENLFVVKPRGS
jgi:uncharacterized protein (TIGR03032 family)